MIPDAVTTIMLPDTGQIIVSVIAFIVGWLAWKKSKSDNLGQRMEAL